MINLPREWPLEDWKDVATQNRIAEYAVFCHLVCASKALYQDPEPRRRRREIDQGYV